MSFRRKQSKVFEEEEEKEKTKLSTPTKKKFRWNEISMIKHITFYVFLLFTAYTTIFMFFLHRSAGFFES